MLSATVRVADDLDVAEECVQEAYVSVVIAPIGRGAILILAAIFNLFSPP